jgi:hypothetical protein
MTVSLSGHRSTDEFKDLTGILNRLRALEVAVVLMRSALGMAVRISSRNVEGVEDLGFVLESPPIGDGQLPQQTRHHVAPCLLTVMEM